MNIGWISLGLLTAVASAAAFYMASPHCRWLLPRLRSRVGRIAGVSLAAVSLLVWVRAYGTAVGVSTMLAIWMLAMIVLPWLSLFTKGKTVGSTRGS